MKILVLFCLFFLSSLLSPLSVYSQVLGTVYHPMTADKAEGILGYEHTLKWKNPAGALFNEVYFSEDSLLVANLDASVRVLNGSPNTAFVEYQPVFSNYDYLKKYYWLVVEHDSLNSSPGPVWYFRTRAWPGEIFYEYFDSLSQWSPAGPSGYDNWYLDYSNYAGGELPELLLNRAPIFVGSSHMKLNTILPGGYGTYISFHYTVDMYLMDTITIGLAYTTNNGISWNPLWESNIAEDVYQASENIFTDDIPEIFNLGFYFTGNSAYINFWAIDDLSLLHPIETFLPPDYLQAEADSSGSKVSLSWTEAYNPGYDFGYRVQRKTGLPRDTSIYNTVAIVCDSLSYADYQVQPNNTYTYRITSIYPCPEISFTSIGGNEATAYVPDIIPVELKYLSAGAVKNNIRLEWSTATETNNKGFEVQRLISGDQGSGWKMLGYVQGNGTSTITHNYLFNDKEVSPGKYSYRLKQIDFNGSYKFSKEVDAEVVGPLGFSLEQNYPNPFNPVTIIKYSIPDAVSASEKYPVLLKVYDILGNEVFTLVNDQKPAGEYEVKFDESSLPSGVYIYRLTAGEYSGTRKLVLLK